MPRQRIVKSSFNAGEFSPRLYSRIDIEKYANGCKTMKNMLSMPHGGSTRRPGFQYIAGTKTNAKLSRVIPFSFSTVQNYIIEAGYQYMRFYKDGGQIQTVDSNTKLLLHCNGSRASTTFTDDGNTGHTVTAGGNAKLDTRFYRMGSASALFDGTTDYLSIADHADFNWGSSEFTVDFPIRFDSLPTVGNTQEFFTQWADGTHYMRFWLRNQSGEYQLKFFFNDGYGGGVEQVIEVWDNPAPAVDTWYHIALIRGWGGDSNEIAICVDGAIPDSGTSDTSTETIGDYAADFVIGIYNDLAQGGFAGRMDEIRISKGTARWTAAFSPPTTQYPYGDDSGTVYELATTYEEDELADLRWVQSADVLFIVSPDREPRKLTRTGHTSWTIGNFTYDTDNWPPFLDMNLTAITMNPSNTSGSGRGLVASAAFFDSTHVGAYFSMHSGYMKVTAVTDSTNAVVDIIDDLTASTVTAIWYESAWSDYRGWPTVVTFYEDRLVLSGTSGNPDRIELSQTGQYENFKRGELDAADSDVASDGLAITLSSRQVNVVRWLGSTRKLLVGTSGAEWWVDGKDSNSAIDATEIPRARNDSDHGSSAVAPVSIGSSVVFAQRLNKVIRTYSYDWETDQYAGRHMSIFAEHLTNFGSIAEMAWQQTPHQIVWVLRSDGVLLGLTYMREHKVEGWHWHTAGGTDAEIESIASVEGLMEDELWCVIKRTVNNATVRYIERMTPLVQVDTGEGGSTDWVLDDSFFVDSGLTYRGAATTSVSGLSHLEGETVSVLAGGIVCDDQTVSAGAVSCTKDSLAVSASVIHVGLPYNSDLEPLWPVIRDEQGIAMVFLFKDESNLTFFSSAGFD